MKILIAVPTYESIMPDTFKSIYDMDKGGHECVFEFVRGYDCARARNLIAQRAQKLGVDYVLMVDNDMIIPADALTNLLEDAQDVCLGYAAHRNTENEYTGLMNLFKLGEYNYNRHFSFQDVEDLKNKGMKKFVVHGGGMACALIRTSVFDRIKFPWFKWENYKTGFCLSEDLYFCEECRKAKIPVYADTRVSCGHMFRRFQYPEEIKGGKE